MSPKSCLLHSTNRGNPSLAESVKQRCNQPLASSSISSSLLLSTTKIWGKIQPNLYFIIYSCRGLPVHPSHYCSTCSSMDGFSQPLPALWCGRFLRELRWILWRSPLWAPAVLSVLQPAEPGVCFSLHHPDPSTALRTLVWWVGVGGNSRDTGNEHTTTLGTKTLMKLPAFQ